jgi:hypothetical protein
MTPDPARVSAACDKLIAFVGRLNDPDEVEPGSIAFVDLHDECDPNGFVDDAVQAVFDMEAIEAEQRAGTLGTPYLDACNAVVDEYERRRLDRPTTP